MNKILELNPSTIREEIAFISNSHKYKIDIYTCTTSEADYVFRRRSNQKLICKVDKDLNIIDGIKSLVLVNDLNVAFERLEDYISRTGWVDDFFDF